MWRYSLDRNNYYIQTLQSQSNRILRRYWYWSLINHCAFKPCMLLTMAVCSAKFTEIRKKFFVCLYLFTVYKISSHNTGNINMCLSLSRGVQTYLVRCRVSVQPNRSLAWYHLYYEVFLAFIRMRCSSCLIGMKTCAHSISLLITSDTPLSEHH